MINYFKCRTGFYLIISTGHLNINKSDMSHRGTVSYQHTTLHFSVSNLGYTKRNLKYSNINSNFSIFLQLLSNPYFHILTFCRYEGHSKR